MCIIVFRCSCFFYLRTLKYPLWWNTLRKEKIIHVFVRFDLRYKSVSMAFPSRDRSNNSVRISWGIIFLIHGHCRSSFGIARYTSIPRLAMTNMSSLRARIASIFHADCYSVCTRFSNTKRMGEEGRHHFEVATGDRWAKTRARVLNPCGPMGRRINRDPRLRCSYQPEAVGPESLHQRLGSPSWG